MSRTSSLSRYLFVLTATAGAALAQSTAADITGIVRDPSGCACNIRPGDGRSGPYLNTACFAVPQNGTFGNASPSVYRDPGSWEVSGAAYKYFPLFREGMKLRINGVFTNLFNHPTWSGVYNNITVPATFGKFIGQGAPGRWTGPRSILLQAQVQW